MKPQEWLGDGALATGRFDEAEGTLYRDALIDANSRRRQKLLEPRRLMAQTLTGQLFRIRYSRQVWNKSLQKSIDFNGTTSFHQTIFASVINRLADRR